MPKKLTKEEVLKKCKDVHGGTYDYSNVNYVNTYTKIEIICSVHGSFKQTPKAHMKGSGCRKCYYSSKKFNTEDFIKISEKTHGKFYDYSKSKYTKSRNKVIIICPIHGEFFQKAQSHMDGHKCSECYFDSRKVQNYIEKCKEKFGNKFDYSKTKYINKRTKIIVGCPIHGEWHTLPRTHLNSKTGCHKCSYDKRKTSTPEFIKNSIKIHGDKYSYKDSEYIDSNTKIKITCPSHGDFYQLPGNHISKGTNCPKCQFSKFQDEVTKNINCKFHTNDKFIISPYELDIFIPDKNIAIECNGNYWHSELNGKDKNYHLNKTKECEELDIQLIHIFESEWLYKKEIVKSMLRSKLGKCKRIYARKCKIKEVDNQIKNDFLDRTHLQGKDISKIKLGLYYNDELVSIMTFCKSRFNKNYEWELSRFSSELNTTVVGGAGKLLKYFIRNYNPSSVITYANRRYSNGNLYKQLGFEFLRNSEPNFFVFHSSKKYDLLSRQQFQKHKLKDKLERFYPDKSAWENMKLNKYDRIWDCGNGVWHILL